MFDFIKNLMASEENTTSDNKKIDNEKKIQIATCALFLEVANSDDDFADVEKELIKETMQKEFNLDEKTVTELMELSQRQTKESVSLYEFTDIINKNFSTNEKLKVVKNLWRLVYADGKLDKYEEYFMRIISKNLHLEHSDMIATKLEAKNDMKKQT